MSEPHDDLTADRVRELLNYDPETGVLRWKVSRRRAHRGDVAGCVDAKGYRVVRIDGRQYKAHRLIFLWMAGAFPKHDTDHKNGDHGDNRWSNIRDATRTQNCQNCGRRPSNTSGYTGVSLGKGRKTPRWAARIQVNGRNLHLGHFPTPEAAYAARVAAEVQHHGEFRRAL